MLPLLLLSALVAVVLAEPPVNRQYIPPSAPSSQYGVPSRSSGFGSSAASSGFGSRSSMSNQYGAPEDSGNYNSGLSTQYDVPTVSGRFNSISSQYGAPSANAGLSTQYGAPSTSNNLGFRSGLSTQYRSHSASNNLGYRSGLSTSNSLGSTSGISTQYGAPSTSNNVGYKSGLSTEYGAPAGGYRYGRGSDQDPLAEPANYEFNYSVQDNESGNDFGHQESRQDEKTQGQYRVLLPDGRLQIVQYEADQEGYKPRISYEETGQKGGYARGPANGRTGGPY